jgi:hypothetical protein
MGRAQEIWTRGLGRVGEGVKGEIVRALKMRLRELVLGTDTLLTYVDRDCFSTLAEHSFPSP